MFEELVNSRDATGTRSRYYRNLEHESDKPQNQSFFTRKVSQKGMGFRDAKGSGSLSVRV